MKRSHNLDKNGNTYVAVQPWYKRWWIWLVIILIFVVGKGFYDINNFNFQSNKPKDSIKITAYHYNDSKYSVDKMKTYRPNYVNDTWRGGKVKVSKIKIYKTIKPTKLDNWDDDGGLKVNGFITIYITVYAKKNISIDPDGSITYSTLEERDHNDYYGFDKSIGEGETRKGYIKYPIKHLKHISDIKAFRLDFDGSAKNNEDDSLDKDFGLVVRLKDKINEFI